MMRRDEMAQAAGAASPEDALAGSPPPCVEQSTPTRSGGVDRLAQLARLIEQDETLLAIVRGSRPREANQICEDLKKVRD